MGVEDKLDAEEGIQLDDLTDAPDAPCPTCRTTVGDPSARCPRCDLSYHPECWNYNGACGRFGCGDILIIKDTPASPTYTPVSLKKVAIAAVGALALITFGVYSLSHEKSTYQSAYERSK